jgi:MoaA/NifB/PqqE/SkfB family radical SAM enzyme
MKYLLTIVFEGVIRIVLRFPGIVRLAASFARLLPWKSDDKERILTLTKRIVSDDKVLSLGKKLIKLAKPHRRGLIRSWLIHRMDLKKSYIYLEDEILLPPRVINIFVTYRCNSNCPYCFVKGRQGPDMPAALLTKILDEMTVRKPFFICLSGGEPLIRDDLVQIISPYKKLYFLIFTNGRLLEGKILHDVIESGNVMPIFGIDGWEETTDAQEGKGTWQHFVKTAAVLKENGIPFGFSAHLDRNNFDEVYSRGFLETMIEIGCMNAWYSHHIPNTPRDYDTLVLTPGQRILSLERCEKFSKELPIIIIDSAADSRFLGGCAAGGYIFCHIENNGDIYPCQFLPFPVGNIREMTIIEALATDLFKKVRKLGKMQQPQDHVAGCIALDKREQMIAIAASDKNCLNRGGKEHLERWMAMIEPYRSYKSELLKVIEKEVDFKSSDSNKSKGIPTIEN